MASATERYMFRMPGEGFTAGLFFSTVILTKDSLLS